MVKQRLALMENPNFETPHRYALRSKIMTHLTYYDDQSHQYRYKSDGSIYCQRSANNDFARWSLLHPFFRNEWRESRRILARDEIGAALAAFKTPRFQPFGGCLWCHKSINDCDCDIIIID